MQIFAVYINGERQQFKGQQYYEDVQTCSAYDKMTPKERVHMHNNVNDTVHVHADAVTWGQFFQNLGWEIDPDFISTGDQVYLADGTNKVTFILNGNDQPNVVNTVIGDEDRLLVSYGPYEPKTVKQQFESIAETAHKHDETQDPASCSGSQAPSLSDRFKHILSRN